MKKNTITWVIVAVIAIIIIAVIVVVARRRRQEQQIVQQQAVAPNPYQSLGYGAAQAIGGWIGNLFTGSPNGNSSVSASAAQQAAAQAQNS